MQKAAPRVLQSTLSHTGASLRHNLSARSASEVGLGTAVFFCLWWAQPKAKGGPAEGAALSSAVYLAPALLFLSFRGLVASAGSAVSLSFLSLPSPALSTPQNAPYARSLWRLGFPLVACASLASLCLQSSVGSSRLRVGGG